jgi:hydroxymethylglutaryl-CoA lyase
VWLAEVVIGHPLYGFVSKAGPRPHFDRLYPMDMPRIETLSQARHFILGPEAYRGAASPWQNRLTSYQRPDSQTNDNAAAEQPPAVPVRAVAR